MKKENRLKSRRHFTNERAKLYGGNTDGPVRTTKLVLRPVWETLNKIRTVVSELRLIPKSNTNRSPGLPESRTNSGPGSWKERTNCGHIIITTLYRPISNTQETLLGGRSSRLPKMYFFFLSKSLFPVCKIIFFTDKCFCRFFFLDYWYSKNSKFNDLTKSNCLISFCSNLVIYSPINASFSHTNFVLFPLFMYFI